MTEHTEKNEDGADALIMGNLSIADVLDGLPDEVAVLNRDGSIALINRAWAAATGPFPFISASEKPLQPGDDYLAHCRTMAHSVRGTDGVIVAHGIESVLAGAQPLFEFVYAGACCPTPRWFRIRVTPIGDELRQRRALLTHVDVTEDKLSRDVLTEREARLRTILEGEPECVKQVSVSGSLMYMNPAGLRMVEVDHIDEILDVQVLDLIHPDDRASFAELHSRATQGTAGELTYRIKGLRGGERWVRTHAAPLVLTPGEVDSVLSVTRDITPQRRAEEELRLRTSLLADAQGLANLGTWSLDMATRRLTWSPETLALFGLDEATFDESFKSFVATVLPEDRAELESQLARASESESGAFALDYRIRRADGEVRWLYERGRVQRDHQGNIVRRLGVVMDVTERREMELALRASEERFRKIFTNAATGIAICALDGAIQEINQAYGSMLGYSPEALVGTPFSEFTHPDDRETDRRLIAELVGGEREFFAREKRYITSAGEVVWGRLYVSLLENEEARSRHLIAVTQDITAEKRTLQSLERSEAMLAVASRIGRLGGWVVNFPDEKPTWTHEMHDLLECEPPANLDGVVNLCAPEHRAVLRRAVERCLEEGIPFDLELEVESAAGRRFWARCIGEAVRDDAGELRSLQGTFQDITERKETERSLLRSEQRFRMLADAMPIIVWTATSEGAIDFANQLFHEVTGAPSDVPPEEAWLAAVHPEDIENSVEAWQRAVQNHRPFAADARIRVQTPDGEQYHWHHASAVPVDDEAGSAAKWYGTAIDIHATRSSEERFRTLARATTDAIWDWDVGTGAVWRSEGFEKLTGIPGDGVDAAKWMSGIHPDDHHRVVEGFYRVLNDGLEFWSDEYRFRRADGTYAYVLDRGYVIRDEVGAAVRMIGGMTDLTERRAVEVQLAEQAELIEKAKDAIVVRGLDGEVRYINREAELLYGWSREDAVGTNVTALQFADCRAAFADANDAVLRRGEWHGELEQVRRDGSSVLVESRWTLLRRPDGEPYGVLAINTDISERKRLEQQILRAQRLESVGTLAGGIAHDLNNLLTPILFSIEMLRDDERDPRRLADLDVVETCARRGSDMISRLLSFARGYEGRRTTVSVPALFDEVEKLLKDTFPKTITPHSVVPEGLWQVKGDSTQLHQVLVNLCVNARDAMPQGGDLTMAAENLVIDESNAGMLAGAQPGQYVLIRVRDTGEGMSADVLERLFEPFFTTKAVGKGSGLGLSTTHAIVRSHGGYLDVESKPGKGTEFRIYLPAAPGSIAKRVAAGEFDLERGADECILVVDDEEAIRNIAKRTLTRYGYRVLLAANGAEGLATYVEHRDQIDLVLTDMSMPIMDGAAFVLALRQLDPNVRIVASSGLDMDGELASSVGAHVSHFINKPYTAQAMLRTLRKALNGER